MSNEWAIGSAESKIGLPTRFTCATSLDLPRSKYASASYDEYQEPMISHIPVSANGQRYCRMEPALNYTLLYIRSGVCFESILCESDRVTKFEREDCTGTFQSFALSQQLRTIDWGEPITLSHWDISGATLQYQWTQYVPRFRITVTFRYPSDFIMLVAVIIANGSVLATVIFFGIRWYAKRTLSSQGYLLSQLFWLLFVAFDVVVSFATFTSLFQNAICWELYYIFRGIASLSTVLHTTRLMLQTYSNSKYTAYIAYATIFLIHFALGFGSYLTYIDRMSQNPAFSAIYYPWHDLSFYWLLFMLIFDLTPSMTFVYKAIQQNSKKDKWKTLKYLFYYDGIFTTIVISNFATIAIYGGLKFVDVYFNYVWGSDRMGKAMSGVRNMCIALHGVTQCTAISHLSVLLTVVKTQEMTANVQMKTIHKATLANTRVVSQ
jgi:hypothetical protein